MVPLEPGRTLSHYRIVGKLGQGGQATAFRADDLKLNRPVVVKALRPELAESESARRRFEREACLCSALEHPNICAIYDMGEEDGLAYIVMQLVDGQTGSTTWQQSFEADLTDVFEVQSQIASRVAGALGTQIGAQEQRDIARRPTANPAAWDAYLKGKVISAVDPISQRTSAAHFERAVALSPAKAGPHSGLSLCLASANNVDGALAEIRIAQSLYPDNTQLQAISRMLQKRKAAQTN